MKKFFLLAALCTLPAYASFPILLERTGNPSQDEVLEKARVEMEKVRRHDKALSIFGYFLMMMAHARKHGVPDDNRRMGNLDEMEYIYILDEINENKELTNQIVNGLWLVQEDKKDESLAVFDEIYKRYSKDKRATARDAAAITRLYKHEDMLRKRKTDEAQSIMDELGREFDINDPGIQILLRLMKNDMPN
jgi:hypothetical protein